MNGVGPGRVVNAGPTPDKRLPDQAAFSECGEFSGIATESLHVLHSKDAPAVQGVRLDLRRRPDLQTLPPLFYPGIDLGLRDGSRQEMVF